ncbi:MAG: hypothetical protein ACR2NZ_09480 [Rubripirellula sp.]
MKMRTAVVVIAFLWATGGPTSVVHAQEQIDQTFKIVSDDWNSLEVVKLIIGLLTPAALLAISVWLDRRIKEVEHRQWSNQKVIEKRLEVYEKLTPFLNEMMCYFMRIGSWKEHDPTEIVDMKRDLDKIAHIYAPLFSPQFLQKYNEFMSQCFAMYRGAGKDAQLRTECEHYKEAYVGDENDDGAWQSEWSEYFTGPDEAVDRNQVREAYQELVGVTAQELGVGLAPVNS